MKYCEASGCYQEISDNATYCSRHTQSSALVSYSAARESSIISAASRAVQETGVTIEYNTVQIDRNGIYSNSLTFKPNNR